MLINSPNISGSLTVTGNSVISGSLTVVGGINAAITGSATTASYVEYSNVANKPTLISGSSQVSYTGLSNTPSGIVSGSSQITYSGISSIPAGIVSGSSQVSFNGIVDKPTLVSGSEQISFNGIVDKPTLVSGSSQITYSGISSIPSGIVSGSSQVSFNGITDKPTLVSGSSQITYSGISSIPSGIVSGSSQVAALGFATTSSNTFQANQVITGSLFISQNLVVAGSSSIQYISSSVVNIADNVITVNAFNPGVRFGGLAVIDSGSSPQISGSILFDSIKDQWIFVHETPGTITSSVLLMGPETYNDLGNETYLSTNRLPKGSGIEHLRDSNITDTGTSVSINSNTLVTGSFTVVTGSAVELQVTNLGVNIGSALTDSHIISGSLRVNPNGLFVSGSGAVGIGTISPAAAFHTRVESASEVDIARFQVTNSSNNIFLDITGDEVNKNIIFDASGTAGGSYIFRSGGSPRMTLTTGGNVGIGVTPSAWGSTTALQIGARTSLANITGDTHLTNNAFYNGTNWIYLESATAANYYQSAGVHVWRTVGSGTAGGTISWTEVMRITTGGNVGIGTDTPTPYTGGARVLQVHSSGVTDFKITNSTTGTGATAGGLIRQDGTAMYVWNGSNGLMGFGTNNTERMRITAGGFVGIRTTGPLAPLHVSSESSSDDANVQRWDYGGSTAYQLILKQTVTSGVVRWNFSQINNSTAFNNVLVLDRGNIGIGVTSPGQALDVAGNIRSNNVIFWNNGIGALSWDTGLVTMETNTSTAIVLKTNNSERMRIAAGGYVGVNITSPTSLLHVAGTVSYGSIRVTPSSTNGESAIAFFTDTAGTDTNDAWVVGHAGWGNTGDFVIGNENNSAGGNVRLLIEKAGNVGINTTSPTSRLSVCSTTACSTVVNVQGCAGQLFSVTDNLVGDIFSVSDISGIPILNVNSDGTVCVDSKIAVGAVHTVSGAYASITGGRCNTASGGCSTVSGGYRNTSSGINSTVGGGGCNTASGYRSTIAGGSCLSAVSSFSTVGGGRFNNACACMATVVGGVGNTASGYASTSLGGSSNNVTHNFSSVANCNQNTASACEFRVQNLSKQSGTFRINHPDPLKINTHYLSHSFVESPTAGDNIYRYKVNIVNGQATITLPSYYKYLNENDQIWVTPQGHFGIGYGEVNAEQTLVTIYGNTDGEYNVLLIGTRKDFAAVHHWQGVETYK
jgi:hypothetical protein